MVRDCLGGIGGEFTDDNERFPSDARRIKLNRFTPNAFRRTNNFSAMKTRHCKIKPLQNRRLQLTVVLQMAAAVTLQAQSPSADSFNPGPGSGWPSTSVSCLAVQPDGKILVGGRFNQIGGLGRTNIARLYSSGMADTNFSPTVIGGFASAEVKCLAVQTNGQIVVGGSFAALGGQIRKNIGRLNADGSVDMTFNPGIDGGPVKTLAVQNDGKILLSGGFFTVGGLSRRFIARLNSDGTVDTNFNAQANNLVSYVVPQPDGQILVGGDFTKIGGQFRTNMSRLNADGTLDSSFNPALVGTVYPRLVLSDQRIIVDGVFSCSSEPTAYNVALLNANGSVNSCPGSGGSGGASPCISSASIAVQADGKILLAGSFTNLWGQPRKYMARLNASGTLDTNFTAGADFLVQALAVQADGKILVGGSFSALAGVNRSCIGRLNSTNSFAIQTLEFENSRLAGTPGKSAPIARANFGRFAGSSSVNLKPEHTIAPNPLRFAQLSENCASQVDLLQSNR